MFRTAFASQPRLALFLAGSGSAAAAASMFMASSSANRGADSGLNAGAFSFSTSRVAQTSGSEGEAKDSKVSFSPAEFRSFQLLSKKALSHNTALYRFALPSAEHEMGMTVASCVMARAQIDGKEVSRPYTPVSLNHQKGYFDLIVKTYPAPAGVMSRHIDQIPVGGSIEIKGPFPKLAYKPNMKKEIGMVAGGTGITPMLQVIHEILGNPEDKTKISLIFANVTEEDILLREEIDQLAKAHPQLKVYYTLDKPPKGWTQGAGYVTKEMISQHLPVPSSDNMIFVCGPKGFMELISGGKGPKNTQGELTGILKDLGFVSDQVYKF